MIDTKGHPMRDAFLRELHEAMFDDPTIFLLSADFGSPVIDHIKANFPDRFYNVGIAEQNLINVAAGLALEGFKVFCYAIAPFITMRCFEQIRVNLALLSEVREINVNLVGVGAGYSYVVSGPTHQCYEDLSIIRSLPNVRIASPSDHLSAASLVDYALTTTGPKYFRFDAQVLPVLSQASPIEAGYRSLRDGSDLSIVSTGYASHIALQVADLLETRIGLSIEIIDLCRLDDDVTLGEAVSTEKVVTIEEGFEGRGGLDAFMRYLLSPQHRQLGLGVKPRYEFELGDRMELHEKAGIGPLAVADRICKWLSEIN